MSVKLMGFDVRFSPHAPDPAWTDERRERYLLRTDVARPLSVDPSVWPVATRPEGVPHRGSGVLDLWDDLDLLLKSLVGWADAASVARVALGVLSAPGDPRTEQFLQSSVPPTTPATPDASWGLLGYDVADSGLTSGLSNCGFMPELEDVAALRRTWAPRLNAAGLFDDTDSARGFRDVSDQRVPEHVPFYVFGLWLIPASHR